MTHPRAQHVSDDSIVQDQVLPQDLDTALEGRMPSLRGLLQHLPVNKVQIEKVPDFKYPLGGPSDHFDKRIIVGKLNGKVNYVYAYLEKTTSEVKFQTYDYNGRDVRLPAIHQLMNRTVRGDAFKFADDAVKLTGLVLYYFMKLAVVETVGIQGFLSVLEPLETVAKDFKQRGKGHLLVKLPARVSADFLPKHDRNKAEPPRGHRPSRSALPTSLTEAPHPQQHINAQGTQDGRSIVSKFIDAENKESDLEQEIVQHDLKIAELRKKKAAVERERERLWEEMSKNDAVKLRVRGGERERHRMG